MRYLALLVLLGLSAPAPAQKIVGCYSVAGTNVPKSKDTVKLQKDVDCFSTIIESATSSRQTRRDRLAELAATPVPKPTPTAAPQPAPVPAASKLGINVAGVAYWSGEATFANQATVLEWRDPAGGWGYVAADRLRNGTPMAIEPGRGLLAFLTPPAAAFRGEGPTTRCIWSGKGSVSIGSAGRIVSSGAGSITFEWPKTKTPMQTVTVNLSATDASDPIRDIDCREPAEQGVFATQLLDYLTPYGVLRFLDWTTANGNPATVTWATRGRTGTNITGGSDGFALEHQIGLANAANASPWFTVPLNADADYQQRMAQMAHDTVPAGRPVYVELSNEVWNYQFGQAHQVQKEGVAAGLSDNGFQAGQYRYAQRIIDMMAIWSRVYADRPRDLVRVISAQAGNPWVGEILMDWDGGRVRSSVDAIAIAPYFTVELAAGGDVVNRLGEAAKSQIAKEATAYAALAKRTGKRLIAYEAGQHLVDPTRVDVMRSANRDARMEGIYRQYIADWGALTGDLLTLYAATGPISQYGAWGLREYAGQPIAETPKLRGVVSAPH